MLSFTAPNGSKITIQMHPTDESDLQTGTIYANGNRVGFVHTWMNDPEAMAYADVAPSNEYAGRGTNVKRAVIALTKQIDF